MSWRYRIGYHEATHPNGEVERTYGIIEFYEDVGGAGKGDGWTDFVDPVGDSIDELRHVLVMMLNDTYEDAEPVALTDEEDV